MAPRFQGQEDDWLDDIEPAKRAKPASKPIAGRARELGPEEGNATVAEIFPNQSAVRMDGSAARILCNYRMATLGFNGASRERSPVCVGDRVRVEADVIVGRCVRRNRLVRQAPNSRDPLLHVIVANIDCLVIVSAAREPEFTAGVVDRFLVAASAGKIAPILCVNKTDLIGPESPRPWSHYAAAGVIVIEACARRGDGTDGLKAYLRGKAAAFCGHSGVGKTSLLRRLLGDENIGKTGELSASSGKGRHTTTGAVLLPGDDGSTWIDTPGIMNFGLVDINRKDLLAHFPELFKAAAACPKDCPHDVNPDCALRGQPRRESYLQILASLR